MKLLGSRGSPFARRVRIVFAEKNIHHECVIARGPAIMNNDLDDAAFLHPFRVPHPQLS